MRLRTSIYQCATMVDSWRTTVKRLVNGLGYSQYHIAVACGSVNNLLILLDGPTRYRDVVDCIQARFTAKQGVSSESACLLVVATKLKYHRLKKL